MLWKLRRVVNSLGFHSTGWYIMREYVENGETMEGFVAAADVAEYIIARIPPQHLVQL